MDVSAFPYLLYFTLKAIAMPGFVWLAVKAKTRPVMRWIVAWNAAGMLRYALIVLSGGPQMPLGRDYTTNVIRALVVVEAILFFACAVEFFLESVKLPGVSNDDHSNA